MSFWIPQYSRRDIWSMGTIFAGTSCMGVGFILLALAPAFFPYAFGIGSLLVLVGMFFAA